MYLKGKGKGFPYRASSVQDTEKENAQKKECEGKRSEKNVKKKWG